jgi:hypothetical protein
MASSNSEILGWTERMSAHLDLMTAKADRERTDYRLFEAIRKTED